jgi:hypothetical protein
LVIELDLLRREMQEQATAGRAEAAAAAAALSSSVEQVGVVLWHHARHVHCRCGK